MYLAKHSDSSESLLDLGPYVTDLIKIKSM
jgi:hypothetical protein